MKFGESSLFLTRINTLSAFSKCSDQNSALRVETKLILRAIPGFWPEHIENADSVLIDVKNEELSPNFIQIHLLIIE